MKEKMEESEIELIDYFRVIWKRKILIIVVLSACMGAGVGVGVVNSKTVLPTTYQADVVVRIGQQLKMPFQEGVGFFEDPKILIEDPKILVEVMPLKYGIKAREDSGYYFEVNQIKSLPMLKLVVKGPDKEVDKILREIVGMLIEDHRKLTDGTVRVYKDFIKRLEADLNVYKDFIKRLEADYKVLHEAMVSNESTIEGLKKGRGAHSKDTVSARTETEKEKEKERSQSGESAFLYNEMLYLKTIDQERDLFENRESLKDIVLQLMACKTILGDSKKYNTIMVCEARSTAVEMSKRSAKSIMMIAMVAGLMMSLFIVFSIEYIEGSKRKGK